MASPRSLPQHCWTTKVIYFDWFIFFADLTVISVNTLPAAINFIMQHIFLTSQNVQIPKPVSWSTKPIIGMFVLILSDGDYKYSTESHEADLFWNIFEMFVCRLRDNKSMTK